MIRTLRYAILAVCVFAIVAVPRQAEAQTTPFWINGGGYGPKGLPLPGQPPRLHWATGWGTGLGFYMGVGEVQTDTATFHANGDITGEFGSPVAFRFVGSSGDVLACYYGNTDFGAKHPGTFELIPVGIGVFIAHFVAEFVPYLPECTGKFAGVSGSWTMFAWTEPFVLGSTEPVAYRWDGFGRLTFGGGVH
jgi:hypothetical protein